MDDLINEDEFLPKEHDLKRRFLLFYIGGMILTAIVPCAEYFFSVQITDISTAIIVMSLLLTPLLLSMIMILGKKTILKIQPKRAAFKIFIMHACCYFTFGCFLVAKMILNKTFTPNDIYGILAFVIVYFITYLFTIAITLPILKRSQKITGSLPQ